MGWWIALAVLVGLAWLPLGATAKYNADGFSLLAYVGPYKIPILPNTKKGTKPEKEKKTAAKKKQTGTDQKKSDGTKDAEKGGPITDFLLLLKTVLDFLNAFRKKLRIRNLELKWIMAGDDPCDLAVNYAKAWAAVGNLMPRLEQCFVIQKRNVEVACDFAGDQPRVIAHVDLRITLGRLLGILICYGVRGLKQIISIQNKRKGGKNV